MISGNTTLKIILGNISNLTAIFRLLTLISQRHRASNMFEASAVHKVIGSSLIDENTSLLRIKRPDNNHEDELLNSTDPPVARLG